MANLRASRIRACLVAAILLSTALSGAGCGAGSRQPASKDTAFRRIQRHEAALQQAWAEAGQPGVSCARRCALAERASARVTSLCELARDIDDPDALARCQQARRKAEALNGRIHTECDCHDGAQAEQPR